MKLFKNIKNYFLDKNKSQIPVTIIDCQETLINIVEPMPESDYDEIMQISADSFIDTTSPDAIKKYKSNLRLLIQSTKEKGKVNDFKIIRNDDYFPYDWVWRVSSMDTGIEHISNYLSYELKQAIICRNLGISSINGIRIPLSREVMSREMAKLDRNLGAIYTPVRFRSTKHFTVNTPLSYTGEYNNVESERNFTIIDDIGNFLNSGYAYSMDYRDAYLDVTHEGLDISKKAIVLIEENKYHKIKQNPEFFEQLRNRKVIVYRGEEAVAINMILSENGVLPARPGNKYVIYDDEIHDIMENSMRNLCEQYHIDYAVGHGNLFGKGGHFSDLYDSENNSHLMANNQFITFLEQKFPNISITPRVLSDSYSAEKFIELVGVDNLLNAIEEYNSIVEQQYLTRFQEYKNDRNTITPDMSDVFKNALEYIRQFYATKDVDINFSCKESTIKDLIISFFHAREVKEQLDSAIKICEVFKNYTNQGNLSEEETSLKTF